MAKYTSRIKPKRIPHRTITHNPFLNPRPTGGISSPSTPATKKQVASVKTFLDSLNQKEANDFNLLDKDSEKKVEDVKAIVGNKLPAKDEQTNIYKTEVDTLAEFEKEYEAFIEQLKFEREYKQFIESLKQQKLSATSAELE